MGPRLHRRTALTALLVACAAALACSAGGGGTPAACVPSCAGRACGGNGCGGSCGACAGDQVCSLAGQCGAAPAVWQPSSATPLHFHWQLAGALDPAADTLPGQTVYDLDGDVNTAATVAALHALDPAVRVVCYLEVGAAEDYRDDYQAFRDAGVVGKPVQGWQGEYWLDIRQTARILPLIQARMQRWCVDKGFDAVEPDVSDVWSNDSGFPITQAENDRYNQQIADLAHGLGLSVGLKNNPESAATLAPSYDWALVEQCWRYGECQPFRDAFLAAGKPVWEVEYEQAPDCAQANAWHMVSMRRDLDLVGPHGAGYLYQPCVPDGQATW